MTRSHETREQLAARVAQLEHELAGVQRQLALSEEQLQAASADHRNKAAALSRAAQAAEHLLHCTDMATVLLDTDLRVRKFTPRAADIFSLQDADVGRRFTTFSHLLRSDALEGELRAALGDQQLREMEVFAVDGRCYLMRTLPYRFDGGLEGLVLSLFDITVLEQARARISQLSAIVESSNDAIIGKTLDGIITSWNAAAERLYGYTAAEAVGKHISFLVPEDQRPQMESWFERLRRGDRIKAVDVNRITKSGRTVRISLVISPIKSPAGNVVGASAIARDLTELRQARKEKEAGEQRVRQLLDSTAEAIYGLDLRGNCTFVNPSCVQLLGYDSSADLLGRNMHEMIHHTRGDGTVASAHECPVHRAFRLGQRVHLDEEVLWRRDGSSFFAEIWAHPVVTHGRPVGAVVTFLDVTDRKEAAEKLHQEIERREQFLAMLSHELRNPLSAVGTATRLLDSQELGSAADRRARRVIQRQTAHMTRLLDDLLDVSRITQNKIRLNRTVFDLRDTIDDVVQLVETMAAARDITIQVETPEEPLIVEGDSQRLLQVQANLLSNAIKYSPHGERVNLILEGAADAAVIRVVDNGAGISREILSRIFDMFVQSDDTLHRSVGGMGVGLTLVKRLVELHGGSVVAVSQGRGQGSEFEVRLPRVVESQVEQPASSPPGRGRPAAEAVSRIVVVEDQDDNREMLISLLELDGYEVHGADNGRSGLELIQKVKPQAAIIDIGLPVLDGYEVARHLRLSSGQGSGTRLIALTGYGQPQDVKMAMEAGFDHHLVKPLQIDKLAGALGCGSVGGPPRPAR